MVFDWFQIFNRDEYLASGLSSWELEYVFGDHGQKQVLVTRGNKVGVTIDEVFLPIQLLEQNPYIKDNIAVFIDEENNVMVGFPNNNINPPEPPPDIPEAPTNVVWLRGPKGDPGERGTTGEQGLRGEKGDTGEEGPQGEQGEKGDTGDEGPQGEQGIQGIQGEQGIQGIQGEKGDTGEKGDKGDKGDQGDEGPQGDDAVAGSLNQMENPLFISDDLNQYTLDLGTLSFVDETGGAITSPTVQRALKVEADANDELTIEADFSVEFEDMRGTIGFLLKSTEDLEIEITDGTTAIKTATILSTEGKWQYISYSDFNLIDSALFAVITNVAATDYLISNVYFGPLVADLGSVPVLSPAKAGFCYAYFGNTLPSGYLWANGATVSRTAYPDYFANVGVACGSGDGSTTVHLPDMRARFMRGTDNMGGAGAASRDPETGTRNFMNTGGNFGNNVGSIQGGQVQGHTHTLSGTATSAGAHTHTFMTQTNLGSPGGAQTGNVSSSIGANFGNVTTNSGGAHTHTLSGTAISGGGTETRPINAYVNFVVKMWNDETSIPVQVVGTSGGSGGTGNAGEFNYLGKWETCDFLGDVDNDYQTPRLSGNWAHIEDVGLILQDTNSILRGKNSFKFEGTATTAHIFASPQFKLSPNDLNTPLKVYFEYISNWAMEVSISRYDSSGNWLEYVPLQVSSNILDNTEQARQFEGWIQPLGASPTDLYEIQFYANGTSSNYVFVDSWIIQRFKKTIGMSAQDPTDFTPVFSGLGSGVFTNIKSQYSISGKWLIITVKGTVTTGSGTSPVLMQVPNNFTLDTPFGNQRAEFSSGNLLGLGSGVRNNITGNAQNATNIGFSVSGSNAPLLGNAITAASAFNFGIMVPINETSSNTTMYNRATTQFASFDGSALFGSEGALIPNLSGATGQTSYSIPVPGGISPTDLIIYEWKHGTGASWVANIPYNFIPGTGGYAFGTSALGSGNNVNIIFGNGGVGPGNGLGSVGSMTWSSLRASGDYRMRVRIIKDGAAAAGPIEITNFTNPNGTMFSNSDGDINGQRNLNLGGAATIAGLLTGNGGALINGNFQATGVHTSRSAIVSNIAPSTVTNLMSFPRGSIHLLAVRCTPQTDIRAVAIVHNNSAGSVVVTPLSNVTMTFAVTTDVVRASHTGSVNNTFICEAIRLV